MAIQPTQLNGSNPPQASIMPVEPGKPKAVDHYAAGQMPPLWSGPVEPPRMGIPPGETGGPSIGRPATPDTLNPGGMPLLTSIPQITNAAHSETVNANAAQTGPADLVENRINGIIDANSPLMQLAASRANQRSNDRGLLSSSMAVGAAQNAVMDAAMPIASQDSQATNQTSQFNASNQQQANLQNATQGQRTSELNAASDNKSAETNIENSMRTNLANLDVSTRAFLADLEQKNKQFIQSSANAATLFNTFQQQVAAIMTSPNLDAAGKERAVQNLQTMLQDSLAAQDAISGLDLAGLLGIDSGSPIDWAPPPPAPPSVPPGLPITIGQPPIFGTPPANPPTYLGNTG